jgi:hypothetical protein
VRQEPQTQPRLCFSLVVAVQNRSEIRSWVAIGCGHAAHWELVGASAVAMVAVAVDSAVGMTWFMAAVLSAPAEHVDLRAVRGGVGTPATRD